MIVTLFLILPMTKTTAWLIGSILAVAGLATGVNNLYLNNFSPKLAFVSQEFSGGLTKDSDVSIEKTMSGHTTCRSGDESMVYFTIRSHTINDNFKINALQINDVLPNGLAFVYNILYLISGDPEQCGWDEISFANNTWAITGTNISPYAGYPNSTTCVYGVQTYFNKNITGPLVNTGILNGAWGLWGNSGSTEYRNADFMNLWNNSSTYVGICGQYCGDNICQPSERDKFGNPICKADCKWTKTTEPQTPTKSSNNGFGGIKTTTK